MRRAFAISRWLLIPILLLGMSVVQATEFSSTDYDLYAGDFNGDGHTDLLYIGKTPDKPSGIALADASGMPQLGFQEWPSNFLNIPWSNGSYKAVIGDFNGDHCSDILLQSQTPGNSYILLANCNAANGPVGQIQGIAQAIGENALGIAWSADQHHLVAGDFDGDGKTDLFFQAASASGTNAIVLADSSGGLFTRSSGNCGSANGPQQCWTDGYQGLKWSTQSALVYAGDFNGDGRSDLLVQARPSIAMIAYTVPFPVPVFAPQSFALFLGQVADSTGAIIRTPNQLWSKGDLGAQWSPLNTTVLVGDFNGDGRADVVLQSQSGSNLQLLISSSSGQLQSATTLTGTSAFSSSGHLALVGKFGGSTTASLYLQATSAGGTNYISGSIPTSGSVTTTATSNLQIAPSTPPAAATGVGATAGQADVTPNGTGRYTIPLKLPAGTAGLTPSLALQYQSSVGNGLLGVGWGISGLSIITRCAMTVAQDGQAKGVQMLASDQYCLDGQRLRNTSGTPGADGSQYRTELETYALVKAVGTGTNGPVSFQVWQKNGLIYEYGATADSRIPGLNGTRVWALDKISDRTKNYIALSYVNGTTNSACLEGSQAVNSYRICQITYTGNSQQGTNPPYTIKFSYQPRNSGEVLTHYYLGQLITEVNRLQQIQVLYGSTVVRSWTLGYDSTVTPTKASRISWVQECGEKSDCFPATTFTWSTQAFTSGLPSVSASYAFSPFGSYCTSTPYTGGDIVNICNTLRLFDFNGDGIPDVTQSIYATSQSTGNLLENLFEVTLGTPLNQPPGATVDLSQYVTGVISLAGRGGAMDLLSEGKLGDVFAGNCPGGKGCWLHVPAGSTTIAVDPVPAGNFVLGNGLANGNVEIDVNGDGFPDQVFNEIGDNAHLYVALHNPLGTPGFQATQVVWTLPSGTTLGPASGPIGGSGGSWPASGMYYQVIAADFNGDGLQDMIVQTTSGWQVLYGNGTGFTSGALITTPTPYGQPQGYEPPVLIDINGDGCTDLVYPTSSSSSSTGYDWTLQISTCATGATGFVAPVDTGLAAPLTDGSQGLISAVDVNGDGYQDLAYSIPGSNPIGYIAYSTGSGFSTPVEYAAANQGGIAQWVSDLSGDGLADLASLSGGVSEANGPKSDLMLSAADGFANAVMFSYAPLTDPSVYTRGQGQMGVTQDMQAPMYVVKKLQSTDGVGGAYNLTYTYQGGHRNVQGRGFLGFAHRNITDSRTGFVTQETYNNTVGNDGTSWEFAGTLAESKVLQYAGGPVLDDTMNQWVSFAPDSASNRRYPYIKTQTVTTYELGNSGTPISTTTTTKQVDNYGTVYDIVATTTEGSSGVNSGSSVTKHTALPAASILNDVPNWCLGKPQLIQQTNSHTLTDGAAVTHTTNESWDTVNCRLTDKNLEVGSSWEQDNHFNYDQWNNVYQHIVSGTNAPSRTTTYDYSTCAYPGKCLMTLKNALGQMVTFTWDNARAVKLTQQDPNGFTTRWEYDDFGRQVHEVLPDGTGSRRTYYACNANTRYCGDGLLRYMISDDVRDTSDTITSYQYVFYDSLGRSKYEEHTVGLTNALSVVTTLYDARGNAVEHSMPYYAGSDRYVGTSFNYDLYNRVTQSQHPTSDTDSTPAITKITYNGLTVKQTDPQSQVHTEISDAWGDVVKVIDEAVQTTAYTYDAFSHLKSVTDPSGNRSSLTYNVRGFKTASSDPDMGSWSYTYDGLGETLSQTDAKSQLTKFQYDLIGRMTNRTDPGANVPDTNWSWDTAANGIGQLGSVTGPNGYSEQYGYGAANTAGADKVTSTVTTVSGTAYEIDTSYDPKYGKVQTLTYPTSTSGRFAVTYDYNSFGYAIDVKGASGSTAGKIFWQANALDARGHVTQATLGNGLQTTTSFDKTTGLINSIQTGAVGGGATVQNLSYSWDRVGNLLRRSDNNQNLTEAFTYDNLYRLQNVTLNGTSTLTMSYDALGNVTSKSDVGAYDYTSAQSGCSYTGLTAQPHAVRKAGSNVYCYDADGNLTSRNGASVSWYPYNQPQSINQVGGNYSTFYYAPDRSRYLQTSLNGTVTESRFYIGGIFEKMISSDATVGTEYRHYIVANGQKVAFQVISASRNSTVYFQDDHLGSTDVMTGQDGTAQVRESYDAWGKRRGSAWTGVPSSSDLSLINSNSHIGYTGQEHLDNLGLIDLNGRVYDPVIARFMSADPSIQAPYESQSLNRYSYTWNNPLNHTDPTGYETCTLPGGGTTQVLTSCEFVSVAYPEGHDFQQNSNQSSGGAQPIRVTAPEAPSASAQTTPGTSASGQAEADQVAEVTVTGTRIPRSVSMAVEAAFDNWWQQVSSRTPWEKLGFWDRFFLRINGVYRQFYESAYDSEIQSQIFYAAAVRDATIADGGDDGSMAAMAIAGVFIKAAAKKSATVGIIYLRVRTFSSGRYPGKSKGGEYVGQAVDEENYASRQYREAAEYPMDTFDFIRLEEIPQGSGRSLDVAEEDWIRAGGGPQSTGGRLENIRHQMSDANYRAAGGTVPYPP